MRVEKNAHIAGDYELFGVLLRIVGNTFDEQATPASNVLLTTAKKNLREERTNSPPGRKRAYRSRRDDRGDGDLTDPPVPSVR